VAAWVAGIGTAYADAKYGDEFVASGVNGKLLLDGIEDEDLVDLGVATRLHRKRIMQDVAELRLRERRAAQAASETREARASRLHLQAQEQEQEPLIYTDTGAGASDLHRHRSERF
jgi:hypothetical protein